MKITPQIICDILQKTLNLPSESIWIYNQRREIPATTRGIFCVVGLMSVTPYSNSKTQTVSTDGTKQYDSITTYVKEIISIDIFSYTTEAVERFHEFVAALRSTYSIQQQELLGLKIADIPSTITDVSALEGTAILYRMALTLQVLRKYDIILENQYYDTFSLSTKTENNGTIEGDLTDAN
jgi:hypothetical protein